MDQLEWALRYAARGWRVLPVGTDKVPLIKAWQEKATDHPIQIRRWWGRWPDAWIGIATGQASGLVVLDIDVKDGKGGKETWQALCRQHGKPETLFARTASRGGHAYFEHPGHVLVPNGAGVWPGIDIRGDGGYVVAPDDSNGYEWLSDVALVPLPAWALERRSGVNGEATETNRSQLVALLAAPPTEGGRNDWLARVAGHLAKWVPHKDAYDALVQVCNSWLENPLDYDEEVDKLVDSVWDGHSRRHSVGGVAPGPDNGFLVSAGDCIVAFTKDGPGGEWTDFDLVAKGVMEVEGRTTYQVDVVRKDGSRFEALLTERELANPERFRRWLAGQRLTYLPVEKDLGARMSVPMRFQRYLEAQKPPTFQVVETLGWHDAAFGFVTFEGVLTRTGVDDTAIVPNPELKQRGVAPWRYGIEDEDTARAVLREVLTFHDELTAAIFGSWWAACFLKPQIERKTSMFPHAAGQAGSESGKSKGYFSLMMELAGSTATGLDSTRASLRDRMAAHHNGPVWIDDRDDLTDVQNLLRQAASGGSVSKKAEDRHSEEVAHLVAPVFVTTESFGDLLNEKAQRDRLLLFDIPSPVQRRSLKGDWPQWDDIVFLRERWGSLHRFAGNMVMLALAQVDLVDEIADLRVESGRHADKMAILRCGARILDGMAGTGDHYTNLIDPWAAKQQGAGDDNHLVTAMLPRVLLEYAQWGSSVGFPPAYVTQQGIVWFHVGKLVAEYERLRPRMGDRERALASEPSVRAQMARLGIIGSSTLAIERQSADTGVSRRRYHRLSQELSEQVLARIDIAMVSSSASGPQAFDFPEEAGE